MGTWLTFHRWVQLKVDTKYENKMTEYGCMLIGIWTTHTLFLRSDSFDLSVWGWCWKFGEILRFTIVKKKKRGKKKTAHLLLLLRIIWARKMSDVKMCLSHLYYLYHKFLKEWKQCRSHTWPQLATSYLDCHCFLYVWLEGSYYENILKIIYLVQVYNIKFIINNI